MQAAQVLSHTSTCDSCSVTECADIDDGKLSETFAGKLKFNGDCSGGLDNKSEEDEEEDEGGGESDGDDDFSFVCLNPDGLLVSADDLFHDGQIRPLFPIFNRDLMFSDVNDGHLAANEVLPLQPNIKKVFIEEQNALTSSGSQPQELAPVAALTYSECSRKLAETSSELCKKSNSTGFSKLWRFRELVHHRTNSDVNYALVFLNNLSTSAAGKSNKEKTQKTDKVLEEEKIGEERRSGDREIRAKKEVMRGKTASSMHHKPYASAGSRGQKEVSKRISYLPHRQVLRGVGFFASVNGVSRNVHPF